jgi:hypothetical protein
VKLGKAIDAAIDAAAGAPGTVHAEAQGLSADVDVVDTDRLGVRVSRVRVHRDAPIDVREAAEVLPDRLRSLPDRIEPVEVAPELGGAILRTAPDEIVDREYFELDVRGSELDLKRHRGVDGGREAIDWTMTRKQLEKLVDELG